MDLTFDHFPWSGYGSPAGEFRCLALSRDGALVAVGCGTTFCSGELEKRSAQILVIDARTGALRQRLPGRRGAVYAADFSPDGRSLAALDVRHPQRGGARSAITLRVMDLGAGDEVASRRCAMHVTVQWTEPETPRSRPAVRWPLDGMIVSSEGVTVARWSARLKALGELSIDRAALDAPPDHPEDRVVALDLSLPRQRVVLAGGQRGLMLWPLDAVGGSPLAVVAGRFGSVAVDRAGERVAALEADAVAQGAPRAMWDEPSAFESPLRPKRVRVLGAEDLSERWRAEVDGNVQRLAFSADGAWLYGADASGGRVRLLRWRASDGAALAPVEHPEAHRRDPPHGRVELRDATVLGLAAGGDFVVALTRWGVWIFRGAPAVQTASAPKTAPREGPVQGTGHVRAPDAVNAREWRGARGPG